MSKLKQLKLGYCATNKQIYAFFPYSNGFRLVGEKLDISKDIEKLLREMFRTKNHLPHTNILIKLLDSNDKKPLLEGYKSGEIESAILEALKALVDKMDERLF